MADIIEITDFSALELDQNLFKVRIRRIKIFMLLFRLCAMK